MKQIYNFINKYKKEILVILILIIIYIGIYYFYYKENFISEGFGEDSTVRFTSIVAGHTHSLAVTDEGKVYAWGYNGFGQLGLGTTSGYKNSPVLITALSNITVSGIAAGDYHSLAFTTNGEVYAWGYNAWGQLGLGNSSGALYGTDKNSPVLIPTTALSNVSGIAAGDFHSLALTTNGEVYAWGRNDYGQLGLGHTTTPINTPTRITNPINCVGKFVNDGVCSEPCGGGKQKQIYDITTPAQFGGETCPYEDGYEKEIDCNTQDCPPIDCVGNYVNIGVCSTTCGPGTQQQIYQITTPAQYGGVCPNENTTRSINCNLKPCPIDCEGSFGDYDTCSEPCGGGTQSRTYTITKTAQHGGEECPHQDGYKEEKECNTDPCPINCAGSFENLGECSRECGGGVLRQFYDITTEAQHGGIQCAHKQNDLKTIPCNTQPCPTYGENTLLQEALKESNNKIQNIRYNIIDRQEELDTLTNKFNRLNKNISKIKTSSNYVPDDKTLTFY